MAATVVFTTGLFRRNLSDMFGGFITLQKQLPRFRPILVGLKWRYYCSYLEKCKIMERNRESLVAPHGQVVLSILMTNRGSSNKRVFFSRNVTEMIYCDVAFTNPISRVAVAD